MKQITVLHLIPGLGIGGAEKVVLALHRNTDSTLFRSLILHWGGQQALCEHEDTQGAIVRKTLDRVISISSLVKLCRHVKRQGVDIIQTHLIDADLLGFIVAVISRLPFVITIHSFPFPVEKRHGFRYRIFSLFHGRFVCVSQTVKNHFSRITGITEAKIDVVHNGIPIEAFSIHLASSQKEDLRRSLAIPDNHHIVGTVARLIEDKGHRYLLEAVPAVLKAHRETTFLIVGEGELMGQLIDLCKKLRIEKNVIFTGSQDDIPALLDIMDIFVYPTFREALGISVIEAMAMGKAIVATNDAAIPELITHEKEGLLIPPGTPDQTSWHIIDLLNHPEKRDALGKAARARSFSFTAENMTRSMEAVYRKVLMNSSR
jgi:glycosyltransferase involved in cell wall biosynthesis